MSFFDDIAKKLRLRMHRHLFDFGYDASRSVETATVLFPEQLELEGQNAAHAVQYEPTPIKLFGHLLRRLAHNFDFSHFVFVDIGSGKGRMLLLAAEWPFQRVEGVELARMLHQIASRNLTRPDTEGRGLAPVVLHNMDASTYRFPDEPLVVYLFNPFDFAVLTQVHNNLRRSLQQNPRECVVIYVNSKHREVFDQDRSFEEIPRTRKQRLLEILLSPWQIAVYRTRSP